MDNLTRGIQVGKGRELLWGRGVCLGGGGVASGLIASGVVSVLRRGSLVADAVGLVVWCRPWGRSRRLLPFCRPVWSRARGGA